MWEGSSCLRFKPLFASIFTDLCFIITVIIPTEWILYNIISEQSQTFLCTCFSSSSLLWREGANFLFDPFCIGFQVFIYRSKNPAICCAYQIWTFTTHQLLGSEVFVICFFSLVFSFRLFFIMILKGDM